MSQPIGHPGGGAHKRSQAKTTTTTAATGRPSSSDLDLLPGLPGVPPNVRWRGS